MVGTAGSGAMAKAKGRPKKPGGEGTQVRIASDLATKAKYLATQKGVTLNDYLSAILRPQIEKDFRRVGRELLDEDKGTH